MTFDDDAARIVRIWITKRRIHKPLIIRLGRPKVRRSGGGGSGGRGGGGDCRYPAGPAESAASLSRRLSPGEQLLSWLGTAAGSRLVENYPISSILPCRRVTVTGSP